MEIFWAPVVGFRVLHEMFWRLKAFLPYGPLFKINYQGVVLQVFQWPFGNRIGLLCFQRCEPFCKCDQKCIFRRIK